MIQKKICLLGAYAVGKTSLAARFVKSIYNEQYLTTIGFKVDKKTVQVDGKDITMIVWDLAGEDELQKISMDSLRGASGYLLVADGTRGNTIETARLLHKRVTEALGSLPFVFFINKSDLSAEWEIDEETLKTLELAGWQIFKSSAKTGDGVEEGFLRLAELMMGRKI
jgi:hypothetical protein